MSDSVRILYISSLDFFFAIKMADIPRDFPSYKSQLQYRYILSGQPYSLQCKLIRYCMVMRNERLTTPYKISLASFLRVPISRFYDGDDFAHTIHPGGCDTGDRFENRRFKSPLIRVTTRERDSHNHRISLCHKR